MQSVPLICAAIIAVGPVAAAAACATDDEVAAFVEAHASKTPAKALGADGTLEDALCTQAKVRAALEQQLGPVIGYKAGLTGPAAQERFGVSEPVMGVLYRDMMLEDGATVPAAFGARPMFEADLILVVGNAAINEATTPEEAIRHISEVRPFIELPDLMYAEGEPITAETLTAMGVGARLGVLGEPIAVEDPEAMLQALGGMTVRVTNAKGEALAEAPGSSVLGNPVNSVLWLASKGVEFEPGDMVSVGSIGPLMPPEKAGGKATVTYEDCPTEPRSALPSSSRGSQPSVARVGNVSIRK
jgi:2-oxo-hept-3-ene-1,7-dioate hydratase